MVGEESNMSNSDVKNLGRSRIAPYKENETVSERHERRKNINAKRKRHLSTWCQINGIKIEIKNDNHHWILTRGKNRAEWYPSSAKLVINQQWNKGIHCHDYQKLIDYLKRGIFQKRIKGCKN